MEKVYPRVKVFKRCGEWTMFMLADPQTTWHWGRFDSAQEAWNETGRALWDGNVQILRQAFGEEA